MALIPSHLSGIYCTVLCSANEQEGIHRLTTFLMHRVTFPSSRAAVGSDPRLPCPALLCWLKYNGVYSVACL